MDFIIHLIFHFFNLPAYSCTEPDFSVIAVIVVYLKKYLLFKSFFYTYKYIQQTHNCFSS